MRKDIIYDFIVNFVKRNGFFPTYQEIVNGIGAKSKSMVKPKLLELEKQGLIKLHKSTSRYSLAEYQMVEVKDINTIKGKIYLESGETDVSIQINNGKIELFFPETASVSNWYHAVHINRGNVGDENGRTDVISNNETQNGKNRLCKDC